MEHMDKDLGEFEGALAALKRDLQPSLSLTPGELAALPCELRLQTHFDAAQAILVLHRMLLACEGKLAPAALHKEQTRIAHYSRKVARALAAWELSKSSPLLSLDVTAANRFITAAIPDLSAAQRAALKRPPADDDPLTASPHQGKQRRKKHSKSSADRSADVQQAADAFLDSLATKPACES